MHVETRGDEKLPFKLSFLHVYTYNRVFADYKFVPVLTNIETLPRINVVQVYLKYQLKTCDSQQKLLTFSANSCVYKFKPVYVLYLTRYVF